MMKCTTCGVTRGSFWRTPLGWSCLRHLPTIGRRLNPGPQPMSGRMRGEQSLWRGRTHTVTSGKSPRSSTRRPPRIQSCIQTPGKTRPEEKGQSMNLALTMDLDNAAFRDEDGQLDLYEVSEGLASVTTDMPRQVAGTIRDRNGNTVGHWEITS